MRVTESENVVYVDVDSTLIERVGLRSVFTHELDYYGQQWIVDPKDKNIEFMKSLKARGYYVIVHSSNGWLHAKKVVELLKLEVFVDEVKTKSNKYIDDDPVENWFGSRIHFD